jgi:hypothetical protein
MRTPTAMHAHNEKMLKSALRQEILQKTKNLDTRPAAA